MNAPAFADEPSDEAVVHSKSIRKRLVLTFMALLIGAMVVASTAILSLRVADIKHRLIDETVVRAGTIATQVAPSLEFREPTEAEAMVEHLSDDPSIRAVAINTMAPVTNGVANRLARRTQIVQAAMPIPAADMTQPARSSCLSASSIPAPPISIPDPIKAAALPNIL